jgi:hypothetical protein
VAAGADATVAERAGVAIAAVVAGGRERIGRDAGAGDAGEVAAAGAGAADAPAERAGRAALAAAIEPPLATAIGPTNIVDDRMPASDAIAMAASRERVGERSRFITRRRAGFALGSLAPSVPSWSAIAVGEVSAPGLPLSTSPSSGSGGLGSSCEIAAARIVVSSCAFRSVGAPTISGGTLRMSATRPRCATAEAATNASVRRSQPKLAAAERAGAAMPRTKNEAWPILVRTWVPT